MGPIDVERLAIFIGTAAVTLAACTSSGGGTIHVAAGTVTSPPTYANRLMA